VASALGHIRAGRAVAVAVTSAARVPQLPDTPTIAETLSPGYEAAGWTGLAAPTGTSPEVVARISAEVRAVLAEPAMIERLHGMATLPDGGTPEAFGTFIRAEIAKWREVARAANVRLEG
jgi:tripartite-type tricarboxylate transporter receptor subunit TctC